MRFTNRLDFGVYSSVYFYLRFSVIRRGTMTKTLLHKLQVKQNYIVRIILYKIKRKTIV